MVINCAFWCFERTPTRTRYPLKSGIFCFLWPIFLFKTVLKFSNKCLLISPNTILLISDCVVDDRIRQDGTSWQDGCSVCKCESGRTICEDKSCNCSSTSASDLADRGCCPHCYTSSGNRVVEGQTEEKCHLALDSGIVKEYHAGEKWLTQCQECECMVRLLKLCQNMSC